MKLSLILFIAATAVLGCIHEARSPAVEKILLFASKNGQHIEKYNYKVREDTPERVIVEFEAKDPRPGAFFTIVEEKASGEMRLIPGR